MVYGLWYMVHDFDPRSRSPRGWTGPEYRSGWNLEVRGRDTTDDESQGVASHGVGQVQNVDLIAIRRSGLRVWG